jgi:predicted 3-demethylubiquinone-9 3-methyltransferase (glyoxalase superfamily)
VTSVQRHGDAGPGAKGSVMSLEFQLEGQQFMALNGGPHFKFTPAISLFISCEAQEEVDALWERLLVGGVPQQCGWLQDKFGLSWQIIPAALGRLMADPDPVRSARVMQAMMKMVKIDVAELKRAHQGS